MAAWSSRTRRSGSTSSSSASTPEFQAFRARTASPAGVAHSEPAQQDPEELLDTNYTALRRTVEADLLDHALTSSPEFFEQLVLELLVAMGYGGANAGEAARHVGKAGDDGIDGVIDEEDHCTSTDTAGPIPTVSLRPNHLGDDQVILGCNASQILACKPGQNEGERKFGLTPGSQNIFLSKTSANPMGWAQQCLVMYPNL